MMIDHGVNVQLSTIIVEQKPKPWQQDLFRYSYLAQHVAVTYGE